MRARGIYGGRIAELKGAAEAGDFAAFEAEKNAFTLFVSGGYRTKSKEQKAAIKEKEAAIFAAVKAGDKAALKTSYAAFIKEGEVINPFGGCEKYTTCQGASNDYDWKMRTKKGAVYQR